MIARLQTYLAFCVSQLWSTATRSGNNFYDILHITDMHFCF